MFDRDKFLKANQENKVNNPFVSVEDGFYILELTNFTMGKSKEKQRDQVVLEWEITEENDNYVGKKQYQIIGIDNDEGYKILDIVLNTMGINGEIFAADPPGIMDKALGMKVKMEIKGKESGGQVYTQYRIKRVLKSPFDAKEEALISKSNLQI